MKRSGIFFAILSIAGFAMAGTFSGNGGLGVSTIGPGGADDYPSLTAAAADFSGRVGGSTGDWTLLINTATLDEANNVAFGNDTNGFNVTVKPAPGITSVITFTTTTANAAGCFSGNWIIGTSNTSNPFDSMTTTSNFTIDGSNNGTDSRNLTIQNVTYGSEIQLVRIVGGCQNTTVKNANIISKGTGANFNVEFTSRGGGVSGYSYVPVGCRVENCELTMITGSNPQNVLFREVSASGLTVPAGTAADNVVVTSNTFHSTRQCINLGVVKNAAITDNMLSMTLPLASGNNTPIGIGHSANGTSGWTVEISRNRFMHWDSASTSTGLRALGSQIVIGGGITAPQTGTYKVTNNFFAGFQYSSPTLISGTSGNYKAIDINSGVTTGSATINILHNSFSMPSIPRLTSTNVGTHFAVGFSGNLSDNAVTVKNNIFRLEHGYSVVFFRNNNAGQIGTFTSNSNTFYLANGAKMASYKNSVLAANYATLEDWQGAGFDAASNVQNPLAPAAPGLGKWTSEVDLHFDGDPASPYFGTAAGVTVDIDGTTRDLVTPVKGAHEHPITAIVTSADEWSLFQ